MTTQEPIWQALRRLEHAPLDERDRNVLRPAFAALNGAEALRLPELVVNLIRKLDAQFPKD